METRLLEIISSKGLSRKQIAKDLGIERRTLDNYINEKTQMNAEMVKRMAIYLKISTDYLLKIDAYDPSSILERTNKICLELKELIYYICKKNL